ncbi:MAG: glycerophosphodiester phosphodiesterase [Actinomycetota bacterium]
MTDDEVSPDTGTLVVAHRGASSELPENTLEAFEGAIRAGADVIETDVRLTSDGQAVVLHDADVSRVTDGAGFVGELTLAEVKRLDASGGRGARAEVPTLREVLELVSGRAGINLEIKNLPGEPGFDSPIEAAVQTALRELERTSFEGSVLVSSFNWLTIERSRQLAPDIPTGFLTIAGIAPAASLVYVLREGHEYVLPHIAAILDAGEAFVRSAHEAGVRVGTWTVDEPDVAARLFGWGLDAVATNDPASIVRVRDEAAGAG